MSDLPRSVLLAGAGKMGGALLQGWLAKGVAADTIVVLDPNPSDHLRALTQHYGFALNPSLAALTPPDVLVLAVKPQMLAAMAPAFAAMIFERTVVVSIMAGKTVADIVVQLPAKAVVRAMPNTPAAVGHGITGAYANPQVSDAQRAMTEALLSCVGQVEWLQSEALIDAVTAVSGSGPAYVFYLTECLTAAARSVGLDPAMAARFARATVEGAGALMVAEPDTAADQLRRNVTSPAGTTAAALDVLGHEDALEVLMTKAVTAARDRAMALAG